MIEDAGPEVIEATNADAAITILKVRQDIKIVFTDMEMPASMDAMKLACAVRDRRPSFAIIVTSGRVWPQPGELTDKVTFLPKPYSEALVLEAVRKAA